MKETFESERSRKGRWARTIPSSRSAGPPFEEAFDYYAPLARVRQFVQQNLEKDLSLAATSKIAKLSPKYFSAFFKQHTGLGFRDWITTLRVQRAKVLLKERNRPVTRVALAVGFRDTRTFQRAFKRVTGMTPIAYKKSVAP